MRGRENESEELSHTQPHVQYDDDDYDEEETTSSSTATTTTEYEEDEEEVGVFEGLNIYMMGKLSKVHFSLSFFLLLLCVVASCSYSLFSKGTRCMEKTNCTTYVVFLLFHSWLFLCVFIYMSLFSLFFSST